MPRRSMPRRLAETPRTDLVRVASRCLELRALWSPPASRRSRHCHRRKWIPRPTLEGIWRQLHAAAPEESTTPVRVRRRKRRPQRPRRRAWPSATHPSITTSSTDLRKDCCSFMDNNNKTRALQALVTGPAGRTPWTVPHTSASSACASPSCRTWQPDQSADRRYPRRAPRLGCG